MCERERGGGGESRESGGEVVCEGEISSNHKYRSHSLLMTHTIQFMFDEDWEIMTLNEAVKRRMFGSRLGMQSCTLSYSTLVTVSS